MLQRPELPVSRLVCLFPFIRQDLSPFQHFAHRTLFLLQPAAVVLARVLSWLPSRLRRGVVSLGCARACHRSGYTHGTVH